MQDNLPVAAHEPGNLSALIDKAQKTLAHARTSAEVLEALSLASFAYDAANKAGRMAEAKGAYDCLTARCYELQADALLIQHMAEVRLADEFDAAQERGEVAGHGGDRRSEDFKVEGTDLEAIGLYKQVIYEARIHRDAEQIQPGIAAERLGYFVRMELEPSKKRLKDTLFSCVHSHKEKHKRDLREQADEAGLSRVGGETSFHTELRKKEEKKIKEQADRLIYHCHQMLSVNEATNPVAGHQGHVSAQQ